MKRFTSIALLLTGLLSGQSDSLAWLEYFPIHLGDQWQYTVWQDTLHSEYLPYVVCVDTQLVTIVGDTTMGNGRRYRHFRSTFERRSNPRNELFRIDTLQRLVYCYAPSCVDSEYVMIDFTCLDSSTWSWTSCGNFIQAGTGSSVLFGDTIDGVGVDYNGWEYGNAYSKGIGLTGVSWWPLGRQRITTAIINGVQYGNFLSVEEPYIRLSGFRMYLPYPNPFNPSTTIRYELPRAAQVTLTITDLLGREVTTLVEGYTQSGIHEAVWDAGSYPSGIYLARLMSPGYTKTIKMVLLK
ncbi:T9SS type A sorting domain-containing protein [Candidatus Neomarinimicrobiota bacterium]